MNPRAVCYLDRAAGGDMLLGIRYADPRGQRTWLAPGGTRQVAAVADNIRAGAMWLSEQLASASTDLDLIIIEDLDGGVCGWLTTPGVDEKSVRTTLVAAKAGVSASGDDQGQPLGWLSTGEIGQDLSIQALGELASVKPTRNGRGTALAPRQRLAILSLPDLCVRIFLDELDRLGVSAWRVMSHWHALAQAWDPDTQRGQSFEKETVVASSQPVTGVIIVEKTGMLSWAWQRSGKLLAGGSMRLRTTRAASEPGLQVAGNDEVTIEPARADVGRLVTEWLAWSTQLGLAPSRIIAMAPKSLSDGELGQQYQRNSGIAALASALGHAWSGADVAAVVEDEPLGATFDRLIKMGATLQSKALSEPAPATDLLELSRRPGKAVRLAHHWAGVAMLALAGVLGVVGFMAHRSVSGVRAQAAEYVSQREELITKVRTVIPKLNLEGELDPAGVISSRLKKLEDDRRNLSKAEEPCLSETLRFLEAAGELPDATLTNFTINSVSIALSSFTFKDSAMGPALIERLDAMAPTTKRWLKWTGRGRTSDGKSEFNLSGTWQDAPATFPPMPAPIAPKKPADEPKTDAPASDKPDSAAGAKPADKPAPKVPTSEPAPSPAPSPAPAEEKPKVLPPGSAKVPPAPALPPGVEVPGRRVPGVNNDPVLPPGSGPTPDEP
jgi:hypothetical protein